LWRRLGYIAARIMQSCLAKIELIVKIYLTIVVVLIIYNMFPGESHFSIALRDILTVDQAKGRQTEGPMDISGYSSKAKIAIKSAREIAVSMHHPEISCEHLLLSILRQEDGAVKGILNQADKSSAYIESLVEDKLSKIAPRFDVPPKAVASPSLQSVLILASEEKNRLSDSSLEPEHLFLALMDEGSALSAELKNKIDLRKNEIYQAISELRVLENITTPETKEREVPTTINYCMDLIELARAGELDPVVGRDQEIVQVIQILSRRRKNNPVLVGGAGVGKTAIVEGLAQRIADGKVTKSMADVKILSLDLGSLVAGAKYKGEFEERFKNLIGDIVKSNGKIILFMDELHTIVGAGNPAGSMDAANLIKPALARGNLKVIGATTEEEYTKSIEKDKALDRRFQKILVEEPGYEVAVSILTGIKEKYEKHHNVTFSGESLPAAVRFSQRYLRDRFLPDKALDLLDESAARFRVNYDITAEKVNQISSEIDQMEKRLKSTRGEESPTGEVQIDEVATAVEKLHSDSRTLVEPWLHRPGFSDFYPTAPERTDITGEKNMRDLTQDFKRKTEAFRQIKEFFQQMKSELKEEDVALVASLRTGIPIAKMLTEEKGKLLNMESILERRVVGQRKAIDSISNAVRKSRAGLKKPQRPIGSFLFLGPTGTGKTELAKALAEFLFDDERSIVRLDMSEYMEKHSVAKIIGAPPGYVGYEEGGALTESVRRKPYSVLLFDEIEKAHPDVFNILLQVMDEGRLTDNQRRTVDFSNCLIILTSNYGAEFILNKDEKKDEIENQEVMELLQEKFKPELLNRLTEIIIFHTLGKEQIEKIVDLQFKEVEKLLSDRNIKVSLTPEARMKLASDGYSFEMGARPVQRLIDQEILNPLSINLIEGDYREGDLINVYLQEGKLAFRKN
jgi:ATP-dependent Clp protease ATP-binding subunit ClpB